MISSAKLALPDAPRLLVTRPDRVGDVIISSSCIRSIRQSLPRAELYFYAAEHMRPLFADHQELDGFISDPSQIGPLKLDAVVHLHPDKDCYRFAHSVSVPIRIGYRQRFLGRYLTLSLPDRRPEGTKHEAAYNFDLLRFLGVPPPEYLIPNVHLPAPSFHSLQRKLPWPLASTPFAVLNPTAHSAIARWPIERFLQLAAWIRFEWRLQPVFIGADANDAVPNPTTDYLGLAGKTDLGELAWLLQHARVLVTRDTGPSHLAAAVGCPVVVLFGRTAPLYGPTRWRPLTEKAVIVAKSTPRKRWESRDKHWRRCFAAISVAEVQAAVSEVLSKYGRAGLP
jgi:ADP-heptose:LPS heptosyltransferase